MPARDDERDRAVRARTSCARLRAAAAAAATASGLPGGAEAPLRMSVRALEEATLWADGLSGRGPGGGRWSWEGPPPATDEGASEAASLSVAAATAAAG